jgi:hypothetical protein
MKEQTLTVEPKDGEELLKRHEVNESPFVIIETNEKFFGTLGRYRLTEDYTTLSSCKTALTKPTWDRIIQVSILLYDLLNSKESTELKKFVEQENNKS